MLLLVTGYWLIARGVWVKSELLPGTRGVEPQRHCEAFPLEGEAAVKEDEDGLGGATTSSELALNVKETDGRWRVSYRTEQPERICPQKLRRRLQARLEAMRPLAAFIRPAGRHLEFAEREALAALHRARGRARQKANALARESLRAKL